MDLLFWGVSNFFEFFVFSMYEPLEEEQAKLFPFYVLSLFCVPGIERRTLCLAGRRSCPSDIPGPIGCIFTLLVFSLAVQKLLNLLRSNLLILALFLVPLEFCSESPRLSL